MRQAPVDCTGAGDPSTTSSFTPDQSTLPRLYFLVVAAHEAVRRGFEELVLPQQQSSAHCCEIWLVFADRFNDAQYFSGGMGQHWRVYDENGIDPESSNYCGHVNADTIVLMGHDVLKVYQEDMIFFWPLIQVIPIFL